LTCSSAAGSIGRDEEVVIFNTGAAQKYVELMPAEFPVIDPGAAIDWDRLGVA
jgi:threonine synthase